MRPPTASGRQLLRERVALLGAFVSISGCCRWSVLSSPPVLANLPTHTPTPHPASCCTQCGKVLEEGAFATDVTFVKGAGGDTTMAGQYVVGDGTRSARFVGGRMYGQQVRMPAHGATGGARMGSCPWCPWTHRGPGTRAGRVCCPPTPPLLPPTHLS